MGRFHPFGMPSAQGLFCAKETFRDHEPDGSNPIRCGHPNMSGDRPPSTQSGQNARPSGQNQTEESAGFPAIPGLTANRAGSKYQILSTGGGLRS